jgi:hypothetical protein
MSFTPHEDLAAAALARPFRPFTIRTRDGLALRVSHPEAISFSPKHPHAAMVAKPSGGARVVTYSTVAAVVPDAAEPRRSVTH